MNEKKRKEEKKRKGINASIVDQASTLNSRMSTMESSSFDP